MDERQPSPLAEVSEGGWANFTPIVHTFPVDDLLEHELDDHAGGCVCGPRVETGEQYVHVVHNALDGRELTEDDHDELFEDE